MQIFGVNEFAARLPNAFAGAISLTLLYRLGLNWKNHQFGLLWASVYAASFLPQFYFRSGIIDPWFNLLIFLGIEQLIKASKATEVQTGPVLMGGVWTGLAVLTKGPAGLVLVGTISGIFLAFRWTSIRFFSPPEGYGAHHRCHHARPEVSGPRSGWRGTFASFAPTTTPCAPFSYY